MNPGFSALNGSGGGITCDFVFTDQLGWPGAIHLGALNWGNNALYADSVTLPPAHTLSFDFHANFFSTSAEVDNVVRTVSARFGQLYPQTTYSHDTRPIGQIFFVTGAGAANNALWATNPRGWLGDSTINVFTAAGAAAFKQRMVTFCTSILHNVASLPLRGFIIWDVEGEQYPNGPATYIGHPSWLPQVAPEMNAIINDLVQIFTNAGYQVGFTLRQQMLVANPGNPQLAFYNINWPQGEDSPQAEADLDAQVRYCQSRFGSQARLFYVDSNPGQEINTFHTLSAAHPDCLFAPECNGIVTRMYAYCQPYQTGRPVNYVRNGLATQPQFVMTYPRAQSLINLAEVADTPANETAIAAGMVRGDIPLIRVWWATSPEIALLQKINPVVRSQGWTGTR